MSGPPVQLFVTCLVDSLAPEVGRATLGALEAAGCDVAFPQDQACCGQPAFNVGLWDEARQMAAQTLDVLDATEGPIVTPSGSCAVMMAHHYSELFEGTSKAEQAARVGDRVRELTQYLVDDLSSDVRASCGDCSVAYHYSCHGLRELGLSGQADVLLSDVDRRQLAGADECCGFGGLFSVEMPALSTAILEAKLTAIEDSEADVLVGGDLSCLLHIEGALRRRNPDIEVRHIAELLADEPS